MNRYYHSSPGKRRCEDLQRVVNPALSGAAKHSRSSGPLGIKGTAHLQMQYTEKLEPHGANLNTRMLAAAKRNPEKIGWIRIVQIYICQRR